MNPDFENGPMLELTVLLQLPCGHMLGALFVAEGTVSDISENFDRARDSMPSKLQSMAEQHRCELVGESNPNGQPKVH